MEDPFPAPVRQGLFSPGTGLRGTPPDPRINLGSVRAVPSESFGTLFVSKFSEFLKFSEISGNSRTGL